MNNFLMFCMWVIAVILSLLALLAVFIAFYQLYFDYRGTLFHSFWIFWHKMKFKTYDFFTVTYYESYDHLWDESKKCYLVAKPSELLIEWDYPVFHKRLILRYDQINSIRFAFWRDIDFIFPPEELDPILEGVTIFITDINNVTYKFGSRESTARKHLFFKGGNFYKAIYEKLPHEKIIVYKDPESFL